MVSHNLTNAQSLLLTLLFELTMNAEMFS